ncbi:MAG: hypothetical protein IKJ35_09035 [Clostridia bacterium]|nr:hypothetical protein [Clostridia bacterium]
MDHEGGARGSGAVYEQTVRQKRSAAVIFKRITFIALYALCGAILLFLGLRFKLVLLAVEIAALLIWALVLFTWRLTKIEYEYVVFDGVLTVSRIFGNRSRRKHCSVAIRRLSAVYPCEGEYLARVENYGSKRNLFAASCADAGGLYAALWIDEKDRKRVLFFEPDDRLLRIMKSQNITAVTMRAKSSAAQEGEPT